MKETKSSKPDRADEQIFWQNVAPLPARAEDEAAQKTVQPANDDSAEMFRGLITGDDHYHTRSSPFVSLWG